MDELLARLRAALRRRTRRPRRRPSSRPTHFTVDLAAKRVTTATATRSGSRRPSGTSSRSLVRNAGKLVTPAPAAPGGLGPAVRERRRTTSASTWRRSAASSSPTPRGPATSSPSRAWATASRSTTGRATAARGARRPPHPTRLRAEPSGQGAETGRAACYPAATSRRRQSPSLDSENTRQIARGVRKSVRHAARAYSLISPPRRSRRWIWSGERALARRRRGAGCRAVSARARDAACACCSARRRRAGRARAVCGLLIRSQSRQSRRTVPTQRSANALAFGARNGVRMISMPSLWKTSSKARLNLLSRSRIRNRIGCRRSGSDQASCRACWVVQRPSGFGGAAGEVHAPAAELDEEEHIEAAEPERLDGEEVAGDHRGGVGTQGTRAS